MVVVVMVHIGSSSNGPDVFDIEKSADNFKKATGVTYSSENVTTQILGNIPEVYNHSVTTDDP